MEKDVLRCVAFFEHMMVEQNTAKINFMDS